MTYTAPAELIDRFGDVARDAEDALCRAGVTRWELFAKASHWREHILDLGTRPTTTECREMGLAVRTRRSGRTGFAAGAGADAGVWRQVIDSALAMERPDPIDPLPPADLLGRTETRPSAPRPSTGWAAHTAEAIADSIVHRSEGRHRAVRVRVREGEAGWVLKTAEGVTLSHTGTTCHALVEAGHTRDVATFCRELLPVDDPRDLAPDAIAQRLGDRLRLLDEPARRPIGNTPDVIFDGSVAAHVFGALAPLFFAREDTAFSTAIGEPGQPVAAPGLSLSDDLAGDRGPIRSPCDAEGLPAVPVRLIRGGRAGDRLATYHDASRLGLSPHGGAVRSSYKNPPRTGITNLHVAHDAGVSPAQLLKEANRATYLLQLISLPRIDLGSGLLHLTGLGVLVDHGRAVPGIVPVQVRGRTMELLRNVCSVGTDVQWRDTAHGCVGSPSILVRGLNVS